MRGHRATPSCGAFPRENSTLSCIGRADGSSQSALQRVLCPLERCLRERTRHKGTHECVMHPRTPERTLPHSPLNLTIPGCLECRVPMPKEATPLHRSTRIGYRTHVLFLKPRKPVRRKGPCGVSIQVSSNGAGSPDTRRIRAKPPVPQTCFPLIDILFHLPSPEEGAWRERAASAHGIGQILLAPPWRGARVVGRETGERRTV